MKHELEYIYLIAWRPPSAQATTSRQCLAPATSRKNSPGFLSLNTRLKTVKGTVVILSVLRLFPLNLHLILLISPAVNFWSKKWAMKSLSRDTTIKVPRNKTDIVLLWIRNVTKSNVKIPFRNLKRTFKWQPMKILQYDYNLWFPFRRFRPKRAPPLWN